MKKQWKRIGAFVLALLMVVQIFASDSFSMTVDAAGSKLAISHKTITLVTGQSKTLKVTGATKTIKWSTSNKKVATVNKKGKVTAKKAGKATIKAKVGKYQLSCKVTVKKVELNKNKLDLGVKDTATLKVLHNKKKVVWSSSNKKVVTVNKKGKLTAKKAGKATIKAKVGKTTYKCAVTVKNNNKSKKDANGTYKYAYKPEAKVDELKKEKKYTVTEVPDGVQVVIKKDSKTKQVESGDVIVLPDGDGNPYVAMKVDTVRNSGGNVVFTGEVADTSDVFERIDMNFSNQASLSGMDYNSDIVKSVGAANSNMVSGSETTLVGASTSYTVGQAQTLTLFDKASGKNGKLSGTITLSAPKIVGDFDIDVAKQKINNVKLTVEEKAVTNIDASDSYSKTVFLGHTNVPIKDGFSVDLIFYLQIGANGEVHIVNTSTITSGIQYANNQLKPVQKATTGFDGTYAETNANLYLNPVADLRWAGRWDEKQEKARFAAEVLEIGANVGPALNAKAVTHDKAPRICADIKLWLHLDIYLNQDYGLGFIFKDLKLNTKWTLLDNNAANKLRTSWHFEDGKKVDGCTFGKDTDKEVESALKDNWEYTLDTKNKTVNLTKYIGTNPEVVVHGSYLVGGVKYRTELTSIMTYDVQYGYEDITSAFRRNRSITSVKIEQGVFSSYASYMFYGCSGLTSLDISNLDTSNVTSMEAMFGGCSSLTSLDISNLDTSNVTDMRYMFYGCSGLTSLDISKLDTSNVTKMNGMFNGCSGLTSLDISNFNTSNVTDMGFMFIDCSGLTSLDVSKLDTSNVTDMSFMFSRCSGLTSLDVSKLDTGKVTSMYEMFFNCRGLTSLDVSNFNTSNVTDMREMFGDCSGLTSLDVSIFNTSNVTSMEAMFGGCSSLTSLDVSNFNTSNVTSMSFMFSGCRGLTSLDVSNFNTSNVTSMRGMFSNCSGLTSLDVGNLDTGNVTDMACMFLGCNGLTSLDVSNFDTSNVTDMWQMFYDCSGLTSLDVSNLDTSNVTSMGAMFSGCSSLTSLDVSNFNTSNVTDMREMFEDCSGLTSLDVSNFNTSNVTNMSRMFEDCSGLTSLDVSNFDTSKVTYMWGMFKDCENLTSITVSNLWVTDQADTDDMFEGCGTDHVTYI